MNNTSKNLNCYWTDIYYHLHYPHEDKINHQAIRILQHVEKQENIRVNDIADYLKISHNTASEHIKRIIEKALLTKKRDPLDERKVLLQLTNKGEAVLKKNTSLDEEKLEKILASLNADENTMVMNTFKLLSERAKQCL